MTPLPFSLEREVWIRARRPLVFRHLVDPERFAGWWGAGSTVDARPGGRLVIRYPNGVAASGEVLEVVPVERFVFSYGYDSGTPIPPGGSRVTITLVEQGGGTLVQLRHDVDSAATRDAHVPGWRHQLARFAEVVSGEAHAAARAHIDAWFAAWNQPDAAARRAALAAAVADGVSFQDRFACTRGLEDLLAHIDAARRHVPATLARDGEVAACQGTALARWTAAAPDGTPLGSGSNVFELDADGRIARVVGLWGA